MRETAKEKTSGTGIPQLDAVLNPMPQGTSLLLSHDPGVEAEPFLYQTAYHYLDAGRTVLYAVTNRAPSAVVEAMTAHGFDPGAASKRLLFVDAFSALMGADEGAAFPVENPTDLRSLATVIEKAAQSHADAVFVLDGLSTLIDQSSVEALRAQLPRLLRALKRFAMAVVLFTKWPYSEGVGDILSKFDGLVALRGVEDRITFGQYFSLERANWLRGHDSKPRLFRVVRPGGVFVYIPKIVVTGPYHAGKTTFIKSVADTAVSGERMGTTVAMDHGHVALEGIVVDIFGTPGQERFDPLLDTIASQALGVVVLVDSTKPETFERARAMMQRTWKQGLPAVVAANKQDLESALPPAEVARKLGAESAVAVVGCVAQDAGSARKVVLKLLDKILGGVEPQ